MFNFKSGIFKDIFKVLLSALVFLFMVFTFIPRNFDPDMWWHIKLGEEIVEYGNFKNVNTYTCSEYTWTNHSALGDVGIYLSYRFGGFEFLYFVTALVLLFGAIINFSTLKYLLYTRFSYKTRAVHLVFFVIFSAILLLPSISVRPQMFIYLFVAFLINRFIHIWDKGLTKKDFFLFPITILVWANLHGSFVLGLALIAFFGVLVFARIIKLLIFGGNRQVIANHLRTLFRFVLLGIICVPMIFFTVNGFDILREVYIQLATSTNYDYIIEWQQLALNNIWGNLYLASFIVTILLFAISKKRDWVGITFLVILFSASVLSARYLILSSGLVALFLSYYMLQAIILVIENDNKANFFMEVYKKVGVFAKILFSMLFVIIILNALQWQIKLKNPIENAAEFDYPYLAMQFIQKNDFIKDKRIFNDYGWGGYLMFAAPEIKWFIDGRMAVWECDGRTILKDYAEIAYLKKEIIELIDKYNIETFLIKADSTLATYLRGTKDWNVLYEDSVAVIMVKE